MMAGKKFFLIIFITTVALAVGIFLTAFFYNRHYRDLVYPGVKVGEFPLGGLKKNEVINFIENFNNRLVKEGVALKVADRFGNSSFITAGIVVTGDSTEELVYIDSTLTAERAFNIGRTGGFWQQLFAPLYYGFIYPFNTTATVIVDESNFKEILHDILADKEDMPQNARLVFPTGKPEEYKVVSEHAGFVFNYGGIINRLKEDLKVLKLSPITIGVEQFLPTVKLSDVEPIAGQVADFINRHPLSLVFVDSNGVTTTEILSSGQLLTWLEVKRGRNEQLYFGFSEDAVKTFLENNLRPRVDRAPQEARFVMSDNKVEEFQASQIGKKLDVNKTYEALNNAWQETNVSTTIVSAIIQTVEPKISTAQVNELGITEIIGVGVSTFKNSHSNRIRNIANAVARLNGILIKPGEEFSTLKNAGPFTVEAGFFPELVIKGKEIKPEIGGGMCQISTTLFRSAMNSGLPITERRNHSLVVNYYADPVNHNPGTDATVYDQSVDFKFLNDTGNYLLLQTAIDFQKQQLVFTLWGKPDGRKGWYNHPTVSKWIPAGDPQDIVVADGSVKPGEKKCQEAFRGAFASFVYTRVTPQGEKIDQEFNSFYRPLPKICRVGATPGNAATSTTPDIPTNDEPIPIDTVTN